MSTSHSDEALVLALRLFGGTILACVIIFVLPVIISHMIKPSPQSTMAKLVVSEAAPVVALDRKSDSRRKQQLSPAQYPPAELLQFPKQ